jgi:hypothetical protein
VEIKIGLKNLTCHVFGQAEEIIQIAQQLAWLGTALQHSHSGELAYSSSKIVPTATASPIFYLTFDTRPLEENRKCCWHGLFAAAVIAEGFPIPTRQQGIGLEIPLQMMAALAGVRHAVSLEGGLILKGYSCAFVPVKRYDDSVQWHFTENDAEDRLPYWEVQTQYPARAGLKDVDFEALSHTRAFVGWWGLTETHLGTEEVDYSNLDYSSAEDAGKSIQFGGVTLGFQQIVSGEVNFSLGSRDGKLHMERSGPYQKIIRCAAKTPVLLYDHDEKRAWLVPSSAVILHIARTRHTREPYTKGGKPISFPFASPRENRHSSADQILLEHASFELSGSEDFDSQSYYLRDVVRDVWSRLETLLDMNVRKERASEQDVRIPLKHFLRGWEFMALVEDISPLREKEASIQRSSGGWTRLAKDIDAVVLFASGFGDIIRPSDEACDSGLCKRWSSVPRGKDYLAASCAMLSQLFDRAGSRLTQKYLTSTHLRWNRGQVLWGRCESRSHQCNCDRLQGIVKNSAECFGTVTEPGLLEADGAVIFGQTSHSFPITRPLQKHQPLYSQENVGFLSEDSSACNGFVDSGQCFIQGPVSATRLSPATGDVGLLGDSPTRSLPKELVKSDTKNKQSLLLKKDREEESELGIQMPCRPPKRRLEQEEEYGILIQTPSTTPLSTRNHPDNVSTKSVHIENYRDLRLRRKGNFKQLKNIPDYICCDHGVDTKVFKTADETERVGMENHRLFEK